ncbi:beta strand repeat-containing protein [Crocosphaera chwakensis]|uniref:Probable aggregation factor core protein MAFp3, isoform C n=1 Tax=Crocosphaera chwakensis CCY0110 TaxID=391612 RepID=A3ISE0_9CHRO|nr:Calx-beta domain-containing protein [Crocosphaera chwakensis]EAZ90656.1 probable aggregation factor core protein MAFp3, isoform C [Crocosphaera chwakensis CCY0110]
MALRTWDGGGGISRFWFDSLNWDNNILPVDNDDIFIGNTLAGTVFNGQNPLNSLTIGTLESNSSLEVTAGTLIATSTFEVNDDLSLSGSSVLELNGISTVDTFTQSGGTLQGTGDLTVTGNAIITGGTQRDAGTTILEGNTTLSNLSLDSGRVLQNEGTVTWNGSTINLNASGTEIGSGQILNTSTGTFIAEGNSATSITASGFADIGTAPTPLFTNQGVFRKQNSNDTDVTTISVEFDNSNTVEVLSGILRLSDGGTHTGDFEIDSDAELNFNGGTHDLNSGATITGNGTVNVSSGTVNVDIPYNFAGTTELSGGGVLNLNNAVTTATFIQSGGVLAVTGDLTVTGNTSLGGGGRQQDAGTTILEGPTSITGTIGFDSGRVLQNENTLTWTGGTINLNPTGTEIGSGQILNTSTGTFIAEGNSATSITASGFADIGTAPTPLFTNQGVFRKQNSNDTDVTTISVEFDNSNTVEVLSGILRLSDGGTHTGDFEIDSDAELNFNGGTHDLNSGATITGNGTVNVSSGTVNVDIPYNFAGTTELSSIGILNINSAATTGTFVQSGGVLAVTGDLTVTGNASLSGGRQQDAGTTILEGPTTITGTIGFDSGRILRNENTLTWTGGTINLNPTGTEIGSGQIVNTSTGTFIAEGNSPSFILASGFSDLSTAPTPLFTNQGVFRKQNSSNTDVTIISVEFDNSNTVEVLSGILRLSDGGTHTGDFEIDSDAELNFNGGTHDLNSGATITGNGTVNVSSGTVNVDIPYNFAGTTELSSIGILNINSAATTGTFVQSGGVLAVTGDLTVTGNASLSGGRQQDAGTTILEGPTTITGTIGFDSGRILRNENTLTWTGGTINLNPTGTEIGSGQIVNTSTGTFIAEGNSSSFILASGFSDLSTAPTPLFTNQGVFRKQNSSNTDVTTIGVEFDNSNTVEVRSGILSFNSDNYTQTAGNTILNGGIIRSTGFSNALNINAGNVSGFGSVDGDLDNDAGTITPGLSVGDIATLNITGDYTETDLSNIDIEIGGLTNFDILDIDGTATFDGTINVSLVNSFTPLLGQTFEIITFDSAPDIATNLSFSGLDIGGGLAFAPVFNTNDLSLVVVETAALSVSDVILSEGDNGTTNFTFTVSLNGDTDAFSVDYDTVDGTATVADGDYLATNGTLNFSGTDGESQTITVSVNGDNKVELAESFDVVLSNLQGSGTLPVLVSGTGTINNDDNANISIDNVTQSEGNTGTTPFTFTVTLNNEVDTGLSVDFGTANGSATVANNDYQATNGTLNFTGNAGETQTITVDVNGDTTVEPDQTFAVNLSNIQASGRNVTFSDSVGIGTIQNDDGANLSINNVTLAEGDNGTQQFVFSVTLSNNISGGASVDFDTANGTATTADNDYSATSGTLNFVGNAGETQTITVNVNGDTEVELNETFFVNLSNASGATIADGQGTGTIVNDDSASLSISDVTLVEGNNGTQLFTFTVTLDEAVDTGFTVDYATANGTASTVDNDYTATSGTLNFTGNAGETQTITVEVNGDNKVELDETFFVNLSNVQDSGRNVIVTDGQGVGTITNDDSASISINNVSQVEGDSGTTAYTFDVTLDNEVDTGLSLDFDTADDTATVANNDYTANSGTLNFTGNAGETQTITVDVVGDTTVEPDEDFFVNLSNLNANGRNVSISDTQGIGTIENDDGAGFSISNATVTEGDSGTQTLTFDVTLNNAVSGGASVDFDTANGTATTADGDYTATSGTLNFTGNAGEVQTITVEVNGDNKVELNETLSVNLSNAIGANIVDGQGVGTITNDDSASISINNVSQVEGDSGTTAYTFDVTLDNEVDTGLSVEFDTADDTATVADNDYTANSGTLNFTGNAGEVETITVEVTGETIVEPDEDFLVNLTNLNANGRNVNIDDTQGTGTIENDDTPPVDAVFSISNATVTEGDSGTQTLTFDVTLNNAVSGGASVDFDTADGTATTADNDYTATSGTLNFTGNAGEVQTITVEVNGDNKVELNETLSVNLSNAIGANIVDGQGTGTITNDDSSSISINNVSQVEGDSGTTAYTFDVILDNEVDTGLSLDFDTADGTATVADNDYTANSGTLNFTGNAGEVETITVEVTGETIVEPDEEFFVNLFNLNANGRDVTLSDTQGVGTIEQDDIPSGPVEINGTPGRDNLIGTAESEIITGFKGYDVLTGMGGNDEFVFQSINDGLDIITDFELGLDVINLVELLNNDTNFTSNSQNPLDLGYVQIGSLAGFTTIGIDVDGSAGSNSYVRTLAVVQGIDVDQNTLDDPNNFVFS